MKVLKAMSGFTFVTVGLIILFFFVKWLVTDTFKGEQGTAQIIAMLVCVGTGSLGYKAMAIMTIDSPIDDPD